MKTVNSLSGGKTSSYIAANYPADYNVFALVTTENPKSLYPDSKVRQMVSDKIGREFIGTLEFNEIINTMLDLEQFIGQKINWISEHNFEDVVRRKKMLPNVSQRFCTIELKINPIAQWCYDNTELPTEYRFGFRANEMRRAKNMMARIQEDGFIYHKFKIGEKNGRNKWKELKYYKPKFPLIEDNIYKDSIDEYWKGKPVRFAYMNNCIGCFHRNEILLKHISNKAPNKFDTFIDIENLGADIREKSRKDRGIHFDKSKDKWSTFKEQTYENIKNHKSQIKLFDDDFNECDSGYCGL
jgi:hypothetical protein|tara:strand:+ start:379 stop:1272 length:894 start_codon:yes stop_codon:yes gene_type:complete